MNSCVQNGVVLPLKRLSLDRDFFWIEILYALSSSLYLLLSSLILIDIVGIKTTEFLRRFIFLNLDRYSGN
jgi:hypothetical protein